MYKIVDQEIFSDVTFRWEVEAPDVAAAAQPGHFVMIRLGKGGERIPLTVADFDRDKGTITLVVQALGKTTREMMTYKAGDTFADLVGPLGIPSHVENFGHVVLVGGGLGVAPVYPQLRAFKEAGNKTTGIIGFRNKDLIFWEDKFREYCDELIVCTDDGSYGREGFVTMALDEVCKNSKPDMAVAIGPMPMMRASVEVTRPHEVKTVVSLNSIMVDGTGMCGSCRVRVGGAVKFACVEGPDFDGHLVDFEELMMRQDRFAGLEKQAEESYEHICKLHQMLVVEEKKNIRKPKELKEVAPDQTHMPERDAKERARTFDEVNLGYTMDMALGEAERCIQCKKPVCIDGCPVAIDIPRFIRHLMLRDIEGARDVILEDNIFPAICGRVCPQETQCEKECLIGRVKGVESVGIGRLERFVADNAPPPVVEPAKVDPKMGKVAIVGSGPAGLSCAGDLVRAGCDVTIYEALHVSGGVLQYGIPAFRLPRDIIAQEIGVLEQLGVKIETNKIIGRIFTVQDLIEKKGYDAVFIGTGAGAPVFIGLPGEGAKQVYSANEFLTRINLMESNKFPMSDTPVLYGDRVAVIGAGNTAMDCCRVSLRIGAKEVWCVYRRTREEAPARIEEVRHAEEEGVIFHWLTAPREIYNDDDGNVTGMRCQKQELGEPDASGRRRPVPTDEFIDLPVDTVIYALGTRANPIISQTTPDLALNKWGYIEANEKQATSIPGVWAGGDIVTGGATVILALGAGRTAAADMIEYLKNKNISQ